MTRHAGKIAVDALTELFLYEDGYSEENMLFGLVRFGHDPSPDPGTTIPGDDSGIVDGHSLDVGWDDTQSEDKT